MTRPIRPVSFLSVVDYRRVRRSSRCAGGDGGGDATVVICPMVDVNITPNWVDTRFRRSVRENETPAVYAEQEVTYIVHEYFTRCVIDNTVILRSCRSRYLDKSRVDCEEI